MHELDRAIGAIHEAPGRWRIHEGGTRRFAMRRFPFVVVYKELDVGGLVVLAVAHGRRRPGYWRDRLES